MTATAEISFAIVQIATYRDSIYLGPHARAEHDRAGATVRRIVEHLADEGKDAETIVTFVSGMTDRFALEYAAGIA